jgi:zinc protease
LKLPEQRSVSTFESAPAFNPRQRLPSVQPRFRPYFLCIADTLNSVSIFGETISNEKMKKQLLSAAIVGSAISAAAQVPVKYTEYDLPNGMHVILHQERATPIVAVSVMYHVGSKNENADRTGFAHFFEHLLFEGSTNIKRGEYSELVEKNGGGLNANTSQDRTYYYELLPSNQLELGLWLESERLLHAKVDSTGIETQREVVKEEKRQRVDNQPYASFMQNMFQRAYKKHPYGWVPIGSMEHLDAAQEADYVNFYRTFYVPSNAVLSIAGDIDIEQTKKWIGKYVGSIPSGQAINLYRDYENLSDQEFMAKYKVARSAFTASDFMNPKDAKAKALIKEYSAKSISVPRPEPTPETIEGVQRDTIYDNIQLPAVFYGYKFPKATDRDFAALEMLNYVLSGGSSARMNKNIVEKKQQAMAAFSFAFDMEDPGIGIIAAIASGETTVGQLEASLDEEIKAIQDNPITEEEFQKIRNQVENQIVSSNSSVAGIAENLAQNYMYNGGTELINAQMQKYMSVTKEDIQRVAKKYLTQNNRIILYYLPNN